MIWEAFAGSALGYVATSLVVRLAKHWRDRHQHSHHAHRPVREVMRPRPKDP